MYFNTEEWEKVKSEYKRLSDEYLAKGEEPLWMIPSYRWMFYGDILYKSKSYAEFVMRSVILGYVNPDVKRRTDETLDLCCRHEPYEAFIYEEACGRRGSGKMNDKARKFRDELIELEKQNGERDESGTVIPTKWQIKNSKRIREWCREYHPNFFKIRGVKDE